MKTATLKNKELIPLLQSVPELSGFKMPGSLTFAIVSARKLVAAAAENYKEARNQLAESRCLKDDKGKPVYEDIDGNYKKFKFETPEIEAEAMAELNILDEKGVEFNFHPIEKNVLTTLQNVTPEQMEVISLLVIITE